MTVEELEAVINAMNGVVLHQTDRMEWQKADVNGMPFVSKVHPLTCGNNSNHTPLYPLWDWKNERLTLVCRDCDYTQNISAGHRGG